MAQMGDVVGKVVTCRGPVEPESLGRVLMHEHLHSDLYDWAARKPIWDERFREERRRYLLEEAVQHLRSCVEYGCNCFCDATMPPWRAWPTIYREVAEASGAWLVLCTGFYREMEVGSYFVQSEEDQIWPFVREAEIEELAEMCVREIAEGIHGTEVRAGAIKLGSSRAPLTELERKTFRAGARAQADTGVHITTHCTHLGAETSQLTVLDSEGVDLERVVIGHTAAHLMMPAYRKTCVEWMKRGVTFLPTNLDVRDPTRWAPLVEAIHEIFDADLGKRLVLGLDSGYCSESGEFAPMTFLPEPPFAYMFLEVLPALRNLGLTSEEERWMLDENPRRILPVQ